MSKLYFYYGTMRSSKSAQAIMSVYNYEQQGKKVLLLKPATDTRDGNYIKSRALDTKYEVHMIDKDDNGRMFNLAKEIEYDAVIVDEVSFFTKKQIEELARIADELSIPVLCFGLLTDFKSELFEGSKRLVELADKLQEIKTVCWYSNRKATLNLRLHNGKPIFNGEQIMIGDLEYLPVSRKVYMQLKKES